MNDRVIARVRRAYAVEELFSSSKPYVAYLEPWVRPGAKPLIARGSSPEDAAERLFASADKFGDLTQAIDEIQLLPNDPRLRN